MPVRPVTPGGGLRLLVNVQFGLVARVWGVALAILTTPLLLKGLGAARFGVWTLLAAFGSYLTYFDFGIGVALAQTIAARMSNETPRALRKVLATGAALALFFAMAFFVVALAMRAGMFKAFPFSVGGNGEAKTAYVVVMISFAIVAGCAAYPAAVMGAGNLRGYHLVSILVGGVQAIGLVVVIRNGWGLRGLAANMLLCTGLSCIAWRGLARRSLPGTHFWPRVDIAEAKDLLHFGWRVQLTNLAAFAVLYSDRFIAGHFLGAMAVAVFELGARVGSVPRILSTPVGLAVLPAAAGLWAKNDWQALEHLAVAGTRVLTVVALGIAGPLIVAAPEWLTLWLGGAHPESAKVLSVVAGVAAFHVASSVLSGIARGIGSPALETRYTVLLTLGLILGGIAGTALAGLTGLLVSSAAVTFALTLYFYSAMRKTLKIRWTELFVTALLVPWLLALMAGAVATAAGRALPFSGPIAGRAAVIALVFEATFLSLCGLSGSVTRVELSLPFEYFRRRRERL